MDKGKYMKEISKSLLVLNALHFLVALPALMGMYGLSRIQKYMEKEYND